METAELELSELCCMNRDGDKRLMWDKNDQAQVSDAERLFTEYKAKGYMAYRTNKQGQQSEIINKFDRSAERIIMQPRMIGG